MPRLMAVASLMLVFQGCASVNWERGFYEGLRRSSDSCRLSHNPTMTHCATLPAYSEYESDRAIARNRGAD